MKQCRRCGIPKPRSAFFRERMQKDGLQAYCKDCKRELGRRYNHKRRDKIRAWEREHRRPCLDCGGEVADSYKRTDRPVRCPACENERRRDEAHERTASWLAMRQDGAANWQIAEAEGVATHIVAQALSRERVARFPDLEWVRSPYLRRSQVVA